MRKHQVSAFKEKGNWRFDDVCSSKLHNVGLSTALLERLVNDNERTAHPYRKFGFRIEGTLNDSYFGRDGKYHNELVTGLILE